MRNYTFHWEVETVLQQFADALNDIIVKRYNKNREVGDQIHVNFVFMPKSRTLEDLINKAQHWKLPVIGISPGNIRRNSKRVFNKIDGSYFADTRSNTASSWYNLLQPVPIDITVNVSIISRFQQDIDQILTNFIPYTDPYFVVSWKWPDNIPFSDFEIRSHVIWNENVDLQYPLDIAKEAAYWIVANTSFTIESWMFKNSPGEGKSIYVIDHSFTSVSEMQTYELMKSLEVIENTPLTASNTDYSSNYTVISARPQIILVEPFRTYTSTAQPSSNFIIYGKMLDYVDTIYLSAANWSVFNWSTTGEFLTTGPQLVSSFYTSAFAASSIYPPFCGIQLLSSYWTCENASIINFAFTPQSSGVFDVILMSRAGYGKMTQDVLRPTLNPYPPTSLEYNTYSEFQYSCLTGIEVINI